MSNTKPNSSQITYDSGLNKQDLNNILDTVVPIEDYAALRLYNGRAKQVRVIADGITGFFKLVTAGDDNGGTIIRQGSTINNDGTIRQGTGDKRWKRVFDGAVNVKWFGAIADSTSSTSGTDNSSSFQKAFDAGNAVLIPKTPDGCGYRVASATIKKPTRVFGEGIDATLIWPTDGNSCFVVASDSVEISDITFIGKTGTGQADVYGDCIKFDAVTNDPLFTRHMEACKVQRVKFRNLKMNGINVAQSLRESHIRECRFVGMGNAATDRSGIYMRQLLGTPTNNNILWIENNTFYRFDNPAINLRRSTLISPIYSGVSYDGIYIKGNLIHGQLQNEDGVEAVQPAPTHHVQIEDGTRTIVHGNTITAIHPQYVGVNLICGGTVCRNIDISHNTMAVKEIVGGVTYSRAIGNSTGNFITVGGVETINITNNIVTGGVYVSDFLLNDGSYTSTIDVNVSGNTTEAGDIVVNYVGVGTWKGAIEQTTSVNTTNSITTTRAISSSVVSSSTTVSANNGLSTFSGAGGATAWSLNLKYNTATNGVLVGSPGVSQFQVSSNGGTPLFVVDGTVASRPGADNTYNLGTAIYRWANVYAGTGTINTSDERTKEQIRPLEDAEKAVATKCKKLIRAFKFKESVTKNGDKARTHIGVIAQEVVEAFRSESLDAFEYGIVCFDAWDAEEEVNSDDGLIVTNARKSGDRYGVRYEELLCFIISAL